MATELKCEKETVKLFQEAAENDITEVKEQKDETKMNCDSNIISLLPGCYKGEDKWLGLELGGDGYIYGVPGSARQVLKIDQ